MLNYNRILIGLLMISTLISAESSVLTSKEELVSYVKQLNDFRKEILNQIEKRNESIFAREGLGLCEFCDRWQSNLLFLVDLIDIHQAGQQIHPKNLFPVDIQIQDSKNEIADNLSFDLEHIDNILSVMVTPYLVTQGFELKKTMKAVKQIVDSLDFLSVYK